MACMLQALPYVAPLFLIFCGWFVSRPRMWTKWSVSICLAYAALALFGVVGGLVDALPTSATLNTAAALCCLGFARRASYVPWRHLLTEEGRRLAACRWRLTRGKEPLTFYSDGKMSPVFNMPQTIIDILAKRSAERPTTDTPERP